MAAARGGLIAAAGGRLLRPAGAQGAGAQRRVGARVEVGGLGRREQRVAQARDAGELVRADKGGVV